MGSFKENLEPLGENPSSKELLWQVTEGGMKATVVFNDVKEALAAEYQAKVPGRLGLILGQRMLKDVGRFLASDEEEIDGGFGIEYFKLDEDITSREGEYRVQLSAVDAAYLLAFDPFEFIEEGPAEYR